MRELDVVNTTNSKLLFLVHARASQKKRGLSLRVAEHAGLQPCVAERAARIEPLHQADEV